MNLNENSSFDVWLQIINMSPFELELDRAEFDINFGGIGVKNKHLRKSIIKSGEIYNLHVTDSIDLRRVRASVRLTLVESPAC